MTGMISPDERIITVEQHSELLWPETHRRVVRLESRQPNQDGKDGVTRHDLLLNALKMRPDRIVVNELRGSEALPLLKAMNTGHNGSLAILQANGIRDVLARLEVMVSYANASLPMRVVRETAAKASNGH